MCVCFVVEDTESRQNLRSMFPDEPMTSDAVETQQRLLLTEQEETLKKMAKRKSEFSHRCSLVASLSPHLTIMMATNIWHLGS